MSEPLREDECGEQVAEQHDRDDDPGEVVPGHSFSTAARTMRATTKNATVMARYNTSSTYRVKPGRLWESALLTVL
jgi:hypothetical protein